MPTKISRAVTAIRRRGLVRASELDRLGIPRAYVARLVQRGILERRGRGLYAIPGHATSAQESLAEVAKTVPSGVVCLLSALGFHGLGTQLPHDVWLAIDRKARAPRSAPVQLRVVRMSGAALSSGIETHRVDGVRVRIYSRAKTVADCFKFRNKIGLDVALEALRDYRRKRGSVDDLWRYAKVCRVARIMQPYLEATA
jgi:predicted transcriptional regulator of viral defense system